MVCAGGGGVPVIRDERGKLRGVEAVVDKDLTAAVLAEALEADVLLILTDVAASSAVTAPRPPSRSCGPRRRRCAGRTFPAGSMGPKVDAVCRFVELTGDMAAIGRLEDATAMVAGKAGTIVTPGGDYGGPDDLAIHHP